MGLGAVLAQQGKIISYASRALTNIEQRYSQTDWEFLAILYGVEHFHLYLFGSKFTVTTDHRPLLGIISCSKPATARIERLRLRLMPYEFELQYRPGQDEQNPADYLSRYSELSKPTRDNASEAYVHYVCKNTIPNSIKLDEVRTATQHDPILQKLMTTIQTGRWHESDQSDFTNFRDELSVVDGVILRDHRLVIPKVLHRKVIDIAHQSHQGIVKTKQLIREKAWFPGIDEQVEEVVRSCIQCQASYTGPTPREPLCPTPLPPAPWTNIVIDFAGPFPSGEYAMVIIDEYSRFPEVEIVSTISA